MTWIERVRAKVVDARLRERGQLRHAAEPLAGLLDRLVQLVDRALAGHARGDDKFCANVDRHRQAFLACRQV